MRPNTSESGLTAEAAASAPGPQSRKISTTAIGPWRRSISQPNSPMPTTAANCAAVPSLSSDAVKKRHGSPSNAVIAKSERT